MTPAGRDASEAASTFPGGGTAGETLRATDWSVTALGPVGGWPMSLKAVARAMLSTRQATCLFWGPELVNLYNDGFIALLGEKHPAAMGQRAREVWSDAWPVVGGLLNDVVTTGRAVLFAEMLIPIVRKGRLEDAWWHYSYSPAFDDDGAIAGILVVATETTAEVAGRRQLEVAKFEAEAASRAKDEFLATVSHELRTPLHAILGWSRILKGGGDAARMDKGLAVIERNAAAQAKLVEEILDVSRIISGKFVIDLRRTHLAGVVQNAVDSVRPAAMAKSIDLQLALEDADIEIIADEDRLQQIVWNLVSNAVKFTPARGRVRVAAGKESSRVVIRIEDTGAGIASDVLPYVFDRFRQDDASTSRRHGGLGLGLAIARHLVELHGGTIEARSEGPGKGATLEVVLPIRAVEPRGAAVPRAPDAAAPPENPKSHPESLEGIHVLVVDDEEDARDLVATVLREAGASVTEASSARAAMSALASSSITVLVSDIGMPAEDGYTLIKRVRSEGPHASKDVPALALTAYARSEDRRRALAAGFHEHAAKPIDPDTLVARVAALARSSAR